MAVEDEIKQLVIARLQTLPEDVGISIGAEGDFNKNELISHVEQDDDIGKQIVEVEMNFLRAMQNNIFYEPHLGNAA